MKAFLAGRLVVINVRDIDDTMKKVKKMGREMARGKMHKINRRRRKIPGLEVNSV